LRSKIAIDRGLGDRETVRVPKNRHPRPSAALPDLCLGLKSGKILGHCTLLTLGIGTDTAGAPRQCRDSHRPRSIRIKLGINRGLVDLAKKACWCKSVRGVVANRWICRNGRSVRIIWSPLNLSKRRPDLGPATPSSPTFLPSSRRQSLLPALRSFSTTWIEDGHPVIVAWGVRPTFGTKYSIHCSQQGRREKGTNLGGRCPMTSSRNNMVAGSTSTLSLVPSPNLLSRWSANVLRKGRPERQSEHVYSYRR